MSFPFIYGQSQRLTKLVSDRVITNNPVPMSTVRELARTICTAFTEHHYIEYTQWFTRFTFGDGSQIIFSEDLDDGVDRDWAGWKEDHQW